MSECCDSKKKETTVLFYSCSGGANVAEIADRAARAQMYAGNGTMFCLAGLGANIDGMINTAQKADINIVIDGCNIDCARKIFERQGLSNYKHLRVTDLGIEKVKGTCATDDQVRNVTAKVDELLDPRLTD